MESGPTQILKYDRTLHASGRFRSGVSLHSHTMHSREFLGQLPGYISKMPIASYIIEREIGKLHLYGGRVVDFRRIYWTPPLSPRGALELEKQQIERLFRLPALVSISDHDDIEAGLHLQMLDPTVRVPISVEWTIPYEKAVFHLGVHNLPVSRANAWMKELASFTLKPRPELLRQLLHELNAEPSVLLVLNHPYWDIESTGREQHRDTLAIFLQKYGHLLHTLELNGFRSRAENLEIVKLSETADLLLHIRWRSSRFGAKRPAESHFRNHFRRFCGRDSAGATQPGCPHAAIFRTTSSPYAPRCLGRAQRCSRRIRAASLDDPCIRARARRIDTSPCGSRRPLFRGPYRQVPLGHVLACQSTNPARRSLRLFGQ